jgi:3-hydroxymyristoyl/3-hydroxydecanoyl-(acyl carrier protein) dehydratase
MTAQLDFTGEPFDALAYAPPTTTAPAQGAPPPPGTVPPRAAGPAPGPPAGQGPGVASIARELRRSVAQAHAQSLRAHAALQHKLLRELSRDHAASRLGNGSPAMTPSPAPALAVSPGSPLSPGFPAGPVPVPVTTETQFKPLARTAVRDLDASALDRLACGDVAAVFGAAYDQGEANASVATTRSSLHSVQGLSPRGGSWGRGGLTARTAPLTAGDGAAAARAVAAAVTEAAQVAALSFGLQLCLADATLAGECPGRPAGPVQVDVGPVSGPVDLLIDVTAVDLVPRPHLTADAQVLAGGVTVGFVRGVTVAVAEKPGVPVGPAAGGRPDRWLGRRSPTGERALLSEFHLTHCSRGDQGTAFGPEFAHYTGRKATRLPDGGLLLVDRVLEINGQRGVLDRGTHRTEYDAPADSWYYQDTANASMPNCVYMETSLQAALLLGYYLGGTLAMPPGDAITLRNLGGTATVLREVDLRDKTISQDSALLSTSLVPGSSLQNFAYTQSVDGAAYYRGETMFGYFSDAAMANQTGLDAGRNVPTWLDAQSSAPRTRIIDVAARRADPAAALVSRRHLTLLDEIEVVDGGGQFGQGYLRSVRAIDPGEWFFARHFRYDPVIPGSLGVESVLQALQEWLLDAGAGDQLRDPGFILPAGLEFNWKYRGQFLPTDGTVTLEAHIKSVQRKPGRVRVTADASLWKPGLRIYELTDAAIELREEGAPPW